MRKRNPVQEFLQEWLSGLSIAFLFFAVSAPYATAQKRELSINGPRLVLKSKIDSKEKWASLVENYPELKGQKDAFEVAHVPEKTIQEITLVTLNPNLGDNIIFYYSLIPYLRERFPKANLQVLSPTSSIFAAAPHFLPITFPHAEFFKPEFLLQNLSDPGIIVREAKKAVLPYFHENSLVIWDQASVNRLKVEVRASLYEYLQANPHAADHLGLPFDFDWRDGESFPLINYLKKLGEQEVLSDHWFESELNRIQTYGIGVDTNWFSLRILTPGEKERSFALPEHFGGPDSVYQSGVDLNQLIFGEQTFSAWDQKTYMKESSQEDAGHFLAKNLAKPERPYLILNLNTRGELKVGNLKDDYVERLNYLVAQLQVSYPEMNILVTYPEASFGSEVVSKVVDQAKAWSKDGAFAFLTTGSISAWPSLMEKAALIVSQDSGFVHVANIFNPRVLTISRDFQIKGTPDWYHKESARWRLPTQAFASFYALNRFDSHFEIFSWIEKTLNQQGIRTRSQAWNFSPFQKLIAKGSAATAYEVIEMLDHPERLAAQDYQFMQKNGSLINLLIENAQASEADKLRTLILNHLASASVHADGDPVLQLWFSLPASTRYPEFFEILSKGNEIAKQFLVGWALVRPHWSRLHEDKTLDFAKHGSSLIQKILIANVLTQPGAKLQWLKPLLRNPELRSIISERIIPQPQWNQRPHFLLEMAQAGGSFDYAILQVISHQNVSERDPRVLEQIIRNHSQYAETMDTHIRLYWSHLPAYSSSSASSCSAAMELGSSK